MFAMRSSRWTESPAGRTLGRFIIYCETINTVVHLLKLFVSAYYSTEYQNKIDENHDGSSVHYRCDLGDDDYCDSWWRVSGWTKGNSIYNRIKEVVTDERWQEFELYRLGDRNNRKGVFKKLLSNLNFNENFLIPISWQIPGDLDMCLCTTRVANSSNCLCFQMRNNNTVINFKQCRGFTLHKLHPELSTGGCERNNLSRNLTDVKWQVNTWQGFVLKKISSNIDLFHIDSRFGIRIFESPDLSIFGKIKYLFAHSTQEGFLKVHNYNFLHTKTSGFYLIGPPFRMNHGSLCLSFYVSMCQNCIMVFKMAGYSTREFRIEDQSTWRHVRINFFNSVNEYEQLYVETFSRTSRKDENMYWAIDFVQLCVDERSISLPGNHTCEFVNPKLSYPSENARVDLSNEPQGFFKISPSSYNSSETRLKDFQITSKNETKLEFRYRFIDENVHNLYFDVYCRGPSTHEHNNHKETIQPEKCLIWPHYFCGSVDIRGGGQICYLKYFGRFAALANQNPAIERTRFTTRNEASFAPSNVKWFFSPDRNEVKVEFQHPVISNSIITNFDITFTRATQKQNPVRRLKFRVNVTDTIVSKTSDIRFARITFDYESCVAYFLQVQAVNAFGAGFAATRILTSPPALPNYVTFEIADRSDHSVDFNVTSYNNHCRDHPRHNMSYRSYILVLVSDSNNAYEKYRKIENLGKRLNRKFDKSYRVVAEYDLKNFKNDTSFKLSIGNGKKMYSVYLKETITNEPLKSNNTYNVTFVVVITFGKNQKYFLYYRTVHLADTISESEMAHWMKTLVSFAVIVFIMFGLVAVIRCFFLRRSSNEVNNLIGISNRPTTMDNIYFLKYESRIIKEESLSFPSTTEDTHNLITPDDTTSVLPTRMESKPVKVGEFEKYIKISISNKELDRQFNALPMGRTKPCDCGLLEVNRPKNRFKNIVPFDYTRVELFKSKKKGDSDYINANYIKGYKNTRYIATQGPKALTINDFWLMIWEDNVKYIVMLVNLEECGQKKVEKYWPDSNQDFQFGEIEIFPLCVQIFADYEIRDFKLVCEGQTRTVIQYHFLRWPDRSVPRIFQTLVPFMRETLKMTTKSPIVVHCCSGTGATGVFILCHMCISAASETRVIDVVKVSHELREQRMNMIDNILQYKLAHLIIIECLTGLSRTISCTVDIDKDLVKLIGPDELKLQMRHLNETAWQNRLLNCAETTDCSFKVFPKKNRTMQIFPDAIGAVVLSEYPVTDESSAYINAVKVDGYRNPERYIVTQQPMPNTLNDFWRMIIQENIEVIISLNEIDKNDKQSRAFWPSEEFPQMTPVDFIILKHISTETFEFFSRISIDVSVKREQIEMTSVIIISYKGWKRKMVTPKDVHSFMTFFDYTDAVSRQVQTAVVTCYDGNLASGVYVSTSYIIERIKLEKTLDMCEVVKIIRRNRKQFITDKVQLAFLYEIAAAYIKGFWKCNNNSMDCQNSSNIYDHTYC